MTLPPPSAAITKKLAFHGRTILVLKKLCKEKRDDIIHVNAGSILFQAYMLFFSRCFGIKRRIAHSHNAEFGQNFSFLRKMVVWNATDFVTCSDLAAECLFGKKAAQKAVMAKNGIDTKRFAFSEAARAECRQKLGIKESDYVIGHVGGFCQNKNQQFLMEILQSAVCTAPFVKLLLVGGGEGGMRRMAKQMGLEDRVVLAGPQKDVENYYCAMDVFAMPSLFEGLPLVGIEAQASGLPCFFSDTITKEVKVTENAQFLPLQDKNLWAEKLMQAGRNAPRRETAWTAVKEAGWDAAECASFLEKIYRHGA